MNVCRAGHPRSCFGNELGFRQTLFSGKMSKSPFDRPKRSAPEERSARDQVLAEWRRIDLVPLELANTVAARSTAEIIPKVLEKLKLDQRQLEAEIVKVWNHTINPTVVAHAQPTRLARGTLFVSVDSSVWLAEIVRYHSAEILARLQNSFGRDRIKRISFRIG